MYQVPERVSTEFESDRRRLWSDRRFGKRNGKVHPRVRRTRFLLYAGLLVGFCALLAFAGCGSIEGSARLIAVSNGVDFGTVTVGQIGSRTISFQNSGPGAVQVIGITVTGPFKLGAAEQFPVLIAAGSTYTLQVQFNPSAAGQASGAITVQNNAAATPPTVSLAGLGVNASGGSSGGLLSAISCTSSLMVGAGTANCNVALNGPAATGGAMVSLASSSTAVIVPATVTVPANATSVGFQANVAAVSAPQSVILTASMSGVSQSFTLQLGTPGSYSVDLTWDAPAGSADPVVGYNIYRALNGSQSWLRLNSSVNPITAFTDVTVASGQSCVYYVTAVDSAGFESAPSNMFSVAIP